MIVSIQRLAIWRWAGQLENLWWYGILGLLLGVLGACTPPRQPHLQNPSHLQTLQQAAVQGDINAQFFLGESYKQGYEVQQDYAQAAYWYRQAANQGLPKAQNNLGLLYEHGQGVPQDYTEAARWYRLAAAQGFT